MEVGNHRVEATVNSYGRENELICPTFKFFQMAIRTDTALSIARITDSCTDRTHVFTLILCRIDVFTASAFTTICSESILCFVRSSTSISRKLPRPACKVRESELAIPLISRRFISSRLKCRLAVGAQPHLRSWRR